MVNSGGCLRTTLKRIRWVWFSFYFLKNNLVNIEDIKEFKKSIIKKVLTNNELIDLLSANNKNEYFFKLWTLKESFLKAIGTGLSYGMQNIEFSIKDKNIICNKIGFLFKQESLIFNNNTYITSNDPTIKPVLLFDKRIIINTIKHRRISLFLTFS